METIEWQAAREAFLASPEKAAADAQVELVKQVMQKLDRGIVTSIEAVARIHEVTAQ